MTVPDSTYSYRFKSSILQWQERIEVIPSLTNFTHYRGMVLYNFFDVARGVSVFRVVNDISRGLP